MYKSYSNNYFNAMNINNILVSYIKNKSINEKMKKILDDDYAIIINMIKNKYTEGINTLKKENETDLKKFIEEEKLKSMELSNLNIELIKKNEKNEEEIKELNEKIKLISEDFDNIKKEKEEEKEKHKNEKRKLNQIIEEKKEEYDKVINDLNIYKKYFKKEMQEIEKYQKQNSFIKFNESPFDLFYDKKIISDRRNSGLLYNIAVYSKNEIGYIVYQNMEYNLIVMRLNNSNIISTLKGHKTGVGVIRYYKNNNGAFNLEEYILSSDNKILIIWDVNDNFNMKYSIQENFKECIFDALILFNLFNKNYILIASDNQHDYNEYTQLYELKKKIILHL